MTDTATRSVPHLDTSAATLSGPRLDIPVETIADRIAEQARRTPERIAISWSGGESWSYARLVATADAIARRLVERGVTRGEVVGICMPSRPETVAAVFGVLRAAAAYLPLDPLFPASRLRHMAAQTGTRHVLVWDTDSISAPLVTEMRPFVLDQFDPQAVPAVPLPTSTGADLAAVLYTSGSTGHPKGVRLLQRNLANYLAGVLQDPGVDQDDVVGAFTTLGFDASIKELFVPLMLGARIVVASRSEQIDRAAASAVMRDHGVTVFATTPTLLRSAFGHDRIHELDRMKLWVGGETLPRDLAEKVLAVCGELWNGYGPTETTVAVTRHRVAHGSGPIPIGQPIANTCVHVLDDKLQAVGEGEIGEIWIGGAGVADGYVGDPDMTAERFVPDPFAADGSRMYRSGDLGSIRASLLYFHGRIDDQFKLNGYRIEPEEIEAAALAVHGVHAAAAVLTEPDDADKRLLLYVVADPEPDLVRRLGAKIRASLPMYMWPRQIETLDALPRTASGKIDRKALPVRQPQADRQATAARHDTVDLTSSAANRAGGDGMSPLVAIQPHGNRPPLFLVHAIEGNARSYIPLARGLGAELPVYGVQALGLDGVTPPLASVATMAACYITEIQRVQPHGPYFLGGGSMGGVIAYEMAQQLREQDEAIGLLVMMDTWEPGYWRNSIDARSLPPLRIASMLLRRAQRMLDAWRVRQARSARKPLSHALRQREIQRVHRAALAAYQPQPYAGKLVKFRAAWRQPDRTRQDKTLGWSDYAHGSVEVIDIPGNHDDLIEQPELLRKLRAVLARSQGLQPDHGKPSRA